MASALDGVVAELAALEARGLRRRLRAIDGPQSTTLVIDGRPAINFSSNDYLGMAAEPFLREAAAAAAAAHGFGAGASRLIAGNLAPHRALEARLADWKGADAALLFNSGYQANVGMVSALAGSNDVIFSDALNHASIIDGCRLSRATVVVYPHADMAALAAALGAQPPRRRRLIVTDSTFSMDGDHAPLAELVVLARRHDALLLVDEAHATGVLGHDGAGLCAGHDVDLAMGTFGKALGGFGAYVAGRAPLVELLANRARSFVFTTALPTPVIAAAHAAIDWLATPAGRARRARLAENVAYWHAGLRALGLGPAIPSHITPLGARDGEPERAMAATEALLDRGIYAQGIRPPTVPPGTSRLRFTLMATHTREQLDHALTALAELRSHFAPGGAA